MSSLECSGKSSTKSQKQWTAEVPSANAEIHKRSDQVWEKTVIRDIKPRSLPALARPHSVTVSCQETLKFGFQSGNVLDADECSPKESISITPRVDKHTQSTAVPDEELKMKDLRKPPDSMRIGGTTHSPPPAELLPTHGPNRKEEKTEEEDVGDEERTAPVELMMEFLRAVMDRDFQLAGKLCQMILIHEPDNSEASEFLPLIQKKLLEEQEAQQNTEEEGEEEEEEVDEDNEDSENSGSDEESSQSSNCSSSAYSSSSPSDDDDEEKQVDRHKPCPTSHFSH
ncbi:glutamic acid-rich protein isoform X2 [Etheostoma spectabile]|uniref:glutamic acid-rich protein isoform X2 n=1 Tax=Etheostoma spectabile TaxID=54343 RepID=UPI0013AFAB6C|nr:glutamic acid-rich protein-like isoform X2 [Etheostoma spectabile]